MKIHQLSLFIENKEGQMSAPLALLADANINIVTMTLADTEQFGILRLIVKEWRDALNLLTEHGFIVNHAEVVAIEVRDKPGALKQILDVLHGGGINIEYMYAYTFGRGDRAVLIFRFERPDEAIQELARNNIHVVGERELFQ